MDFIKNLTGAEEQKPVEPPKETTIIDKLAGMLGGQQTEEPPKETSFMDKLHGAVGGGPQSEQHEDALDKGKFSRCARAKCVF